MRDLLNKDVLAQSLVCPDPRGAVLTRDGVSLLVACRGSDEVMFFNTAAFNVTARIRGIGSRPEELELSEDGASAKVLDHDGRTIGRVDIGISRSAPPKVSRAAKKNELVFLGMIHGEHRTSARYGLATLKDLIAKIHPDYVLTEIPPNRLDRASMEFAATGHIAEPRVSRFPEYVDVLFSLQASAGYKIVGTSAWTQPMDRYRRDRLAAIGQDPARAIEWAEYQAAIKASEAALSKGGAGDDPRWIHTDAYDAAQRIELEVYNRLFDPELGTGGWDTINKAHFANITRVLDEHRDEGLRFLVTYGAGHKSWMLPRLRARGDLQVLDVSSFLNDVAPTAPKISK